MRTLKSRLNMWDIFPLLWLAFLAFPVSGFLSRPHPPAQWWLFWGVLLAFVAVYAKAYLTERHSERWAFLGWGAALAAHLLTLNVTGGQAAAFLVFGGSLIGNQPSLALALWLAGVNCLVMVWPLLASHAGIWDIFSAVPLMLFTLMGAYTNNAAYQASLARRQLVQVQLEKEKLAADAERERIARDLHDLLGHTLSVIVLKSELAGKLAEKNPPLAAEQIREVERISREALNEVRAAVRGYRGSGFSAELARAKVALDTAGIKLSMLAPVPELPGNVETGAAMLLREAITNVVRHSGASEVKVALLAGAQGYVLTVDDNGIGGNAPEGTGLNSMRERVRAVGGTLERDGSGGTRLVATFPAGGGDGGMVPEDRSLESAHA